MDQSVSFDAPLPAESAPTAPWRLVLSALLWIGVVVVVFLLAVAALTFAGLALRHSLAPPSADIVNMISIVVAAIIIYGGLFLVAVRKARRLGGGDVRAGLGYGPIRRRRFALMMGGLLIGVVTVYLAASAVSPPFRDFFKGAQPTPLPHESLAGNLLFGVFWLIAVLCAPVVEELYFRGWLWTGLRQSLSPVATSLITGGLWLACHLGEGLTRPIVLLPAAIILSIVRHHSASVRATIAIHFTNNLFAFLVLAAVAGLAK